MYGVMRWGVRVGGIVWRVEGEGVHGCRMRPCMYIFFFHLVYILHTCYKTRRKFPHVCRYAIRHVAHAWKASER